jgi:CRP/FNR family transcriptional regulator, cyclic AMP receptor protein
MQRALLAACPRLVAGAGTAVQVPLGTDFLVVEQGVAMSVVHGPNRRFVVSFAGEGDVVLSPADGIELEALRASSLRAISRETRKRLLLDPVASDEVYAGLAAAVAERDQSLSQFAARLHDDRVLAKLVQLGGKFGRVTPDGIRLDLPLTHQLLADAVGAARETVSATVRQLQRTGTIERVGRTYVLKLEPHELA